MAQIYFKIFSVETAQPCILVRDLKPCLWNQGLISYFQLYILKYDFLFYNYNFNVYFTM